MVWRFQMVTGDAVLCCVAKHKEKLTKGGYCRVY